MKKDIGTEKQIFSGTNVLFAAMDPEETASDKFYANKIK